MTRYVALLRGINVGGRNPIKMTALRTCLEQGGFDDVATYIQSGNVVFTADASSNARLTTDVEEMLLGAFGYDISVVLRSRQQMRTIVDGAPMGFGREPDTYRYDVIFPKAPLTARSAMKDIQTKDGVDTAHLGTGALYFARLIARASQSRLSKIVSIPIYKSITIRNWNTTTRLMQMLEPDHGDAG